ncbi:DUF2142 domain-containing protein [Streptococcus himalayensis]|uniref:DUF2142 domain-containing protein n=1 Tax=Streptococcus himalayensis TaxID=1888195 RepID=A0A917EFI5_9STRE|nr:DUF2142 domain-containing protein [Streptococcus himalayensis]GGE27883.1 hypothetical protein GCM10011510_06320 [Streptococcus himalayensis]
MEGKLFMENLINRLEVRKKKASYVIFVIVFFIVSIINIPINEPIPKKLLVLLFFSGILLIIFKPKKLPVAAALIILVTGLFSSFLTPIGDVPDETAHYYRSVFVSEGDVNLSNDLENLKVSEDTQNVQSKNKTLIINSQLNNMKHQSKEKVAPEVTITNIYSFISYVPQALGLAIGNALNISIVFSYWLGRFFNVLAYALLCYLAIRLASKAEQLIAVAALLPMNVYLSASYNQDSVALGVILLVIGLFCNFAYSNKKITLPKYMFYTMLCVLLAVIKFPFIVLIALPFFLPSERFEMKHSWLIKICSIFIVFILSILWLKISAQVHNVTMAGTEAFKDVNSKEQLLSMIHSPVNYSLVILKESLLRILKPENMNLFGWLTYGPTFLVGWNMIFYFLVILNNAGKLKINWLSKVLLSMIIAAITIGIVLSMYISWTPVGTLAVGGVQDRYFLGVVPLILIFFTTNNATFEKYQGVIHDSLILDISMCFIYTMLLSTLFTYYAW